MKAQQATSDTIVGTFIIAGVLAIVLLTFIIRDDLFGGTYEVKASFQSISGLEYGSPVLVSGIRNGRVVSIEYTSPEELEPVQIYDDYGQVVEEIIQPVVVTLRVSDEINIYSNATVRLVQQGFIGDKRVEIDPGSPKLGARLITSDSPPIPGQPIFDMENVMRKADAIVTDVQATVSEFRSFVDDDENVVALRTTLRNLNSSVEKVYEYLENNQENVEVAIENIRQVSSEMVEVTERAKLFMEEGGRFDSISGDVESTLADLRMDLDELVATANETVGTINDTVAKIDERSERFTGSAVDLMDSTKTNIADLTENLATTSENLDVIISRVRSGEGTVGRLLTDPEPFEDLKETIDALHNFILGEQSQYYEFDIKYSDPESAGQAN